MHIHRRDASGMRREVALPFFLRHAPSTYCPGFISSCLSAKAPYNGGRLPGNWDPARREAGPDATGVLSSTNKREAGLSSGSIDFASVSFTPRAAETRGPTAARVSHTTRVALNVWEKHPVGVSSRNLHEQIEKTALLCSQKRGKKRLQILPLLLSPAGWYVRQ